MSVGFFFDRVAESNDMWYVACSFSTLTTVLGFVGNYCNILAIACDR